MSPFRLSPSRLARYFYHGCDRYLRFAATPGEMRSEFGVPDVEDEASAMSGRLLDAGFEWERTVVTNHLHGRVRIAESSDESEICNRMHDVPATLQALRLLRENEFLYQGSVRAPAEFYERYDIDPAIASFSTCRPDLIECRRNGGSRYIYRIHDLKASSDLKPSFRMQVSVYAMQLREILMTHGIDRDADCAVGGIWLHGTTAPEVFDLRPTLEIAERFFRERLTHILTQPLEKVDWHVWYRCEWCPWFSHCRAEAERKRSVSLIPRLTVHGRRFLKEAPWDSGRSVNTLDDLRRVLDDPAQAVKMNACGSLRGKADRLRNQVESLERGAVILYGGSCLSLPRFEHVQVILCLQSDPTTGSVYAAGFRRCGGVEIYGDDERLKMFVAPSPEETPTIQLNFVKAVHAELSMLHDFNQIREWRARLSVQFYTFDSYEAVLFHELLMQAVKEPETAEAATRLLFYFQNSDLITNKEHPESDGHIPLTVVTAAINQLVAMPFPFFIRLADASRALPSIMQPFQYEPNGEFSFVLSNRMKSDAIMKIWETGDADQFNAIEAEITQRLFATSAIIDGLRQKMHGRLFSWAARFQFPVTWDMRSEELSRLSFFVRHESVSGMIATKENRARPWTERLREEISIPLIYEGGNRCRVESEIEGAELADDEFGRYLLVPNDAAGDIEQQQFNDWYYRDKTWCPSKGRLRYAGISRIHRDKRGMVEALDLTVSKNRNHDPIRIGDRMVMQERFVDFLSERLIQRLREIDQDDAGGFLQLLRNPVECSHSKNDDVIATLANRPHSDEHFSENRNQRKAIRKFIERNLTCVWGPPGSGKTRTVAAAILTLASAHHAAGKPLIVAVSAVAHSAIENLLLMITKLVPHYGLENIIGLFKLDDIHTRRAKGLKTVPARKAAGLRNGHPILVVGGTAYALEKAIRHGMEPCDALIVDESSQMKWPEFGLAFRAKTPEGRLLLAGDDQQLPPIVQGNYPTPEDGSPSLLDSIFAYLRAKDSAERPYTTALTQQYRMNETLSRFPAMTLYGEKYRPASRRISNRVLRLLPRRSSQTQTEEEAFVNWVIDPAWPLVLLIVEGVQATVENFVEAEVVAVLSDALRRRQWKDGTRRVYPHTEEGERLFWNEGLFIVSPHHLQIRAIKAALARRREWESPPFVATVEKMQGQESTCVITSYGVSDIEAAMNEGQFIFSENRLNVSLTRAKCKSIVCLPRPLLEPLIELLDDDEAAKGMAFMHSLNDFCREHGEEQTFALDFFGDIGGGKRLTAIRARYPKPQHS